MPAFYNQPTTIADLISHVTARVLDHFDLDTPNARRWEGLPGVHSVANATAP
jgi:flavin prenyltransferase